MLVEFPLPDLSATVALAADVAPRLHKGVCVALRGNLGAGKTEFARALLRVMGVTGDVPSPTFTLLQTYDVGGFLVSHFDLYRLQSPDELDELGWDDALSDGIVLVEWPDRAGARLPEQRIEILFDLLPDGTRKALIKGR